MSLVQWMDRVLYPGSERGWDNKLFASVASCLLTPNATILDLGAGAGICRDLDWRAEGRKVCGVDPDHVVMENPFLDEARVASGESIPYPDNTFDVVLCHNVLEHLAEPEKVFREVSRVLKTGGVFAVKTPNRWHYVSLIGRITPFWFHVSVNRLRGRREVDTYPTYYRVNTPKALLLVCERAGLAVEDLRLIEGRPEYLRIHGILYVCGWLYERIVNSFSALARVRVLMIAVMRK